MRRAENAEEAKTREETRQRQRQKQNKEKPAEFRAMNVKCASRNSLERSSKRAWKGADKGGHLAPLTPLTRAAHARKCARRAREQSRLRGAAIECRALTMCHAINGAYTYIRLQFLKRETAIRGGKNSSAHRRRVRKDFTWAHIVHIR